MALAWLKCLVGGLAASSLRTNRRPRYRPAMELLEDRVVPVTAVTNLQATTAQALVSALVGNNPGITVSNIQYSGDLRAAGTFTGGQNSIGMSEGIVLSTGQADQIVGPHGATPSTLLGLPNGGPGDPQLDTLAAPNTTVDATVLQFDFVPTGNTITLSYVFGSGDYNAGVAGPGDVFGIFVNGQNVAFVPGTSTPINVTTINGTTNQQFFVDNTTGSRNVNINGFTTVLSATIPVNAHVTNHLKFAIGDVGNTEVGTITAATNASPIAITTAAPHGLVTGTRVTISGVTGNTAANGTFIITVTGANTFTLNGTTGNGAYTGGGIVTVNGLIDSQLLIGSDGAIAGDGTTLHGIATANVNAYHPLRYVYNAATTTFDGNITVVSHYPFDLPGPNFALLPSFPTPAAVLPATVTLLPATVTVTNPTGTTATGGNFFIMPTTNAKLVSQTPARVKIKLSNPANVFLSSFFEGYELEGTSVLL